MSHLYSHFFRHHQTALPVLCRASPPTDPNKRYVLYHPKATPPVASSPQCVHSRAELLSARTAHSSYQDHVGGGSAPSSSGPVQHLGNPATPLKPEIILGSPPPPPAPFLHPPSARDLQTPSAYPIWYSACIDKLLSKFRDLCTAYLSNLLSGKAHVHSHVDHPPPKDSQVIPAPPPPSPPL